MIFSNNHIRRIKALGRKRLSVVLFVLFLALCPGSLLAKDSAPSDTWVFMADLYAWMPAIDLTSASGQETSIDFSNILDNLNFTVMGSVGARKDKWFLGTDVLYMNLSDTATTTATVARVGTAAVNANVDLKVWIVTPIAGYRVIDKEKFTMDVFAGARYLHLKVGVDASNANPFGLPLLINRSDSTDNWDGIVGVRGDINLTEKWHLPYYLDIGTGDSKYTWQGFAGVGYRINSFDIVAGYRYLDYDLDDNKVIDDMTVRGPLVGFRYFF